MYSLLSYHAGQMAGEFEFGLSYAEAVQPHINQSLLEQQDSWHGYCYIEVQNVHACCDKYIWYGGGKILQELGRSQCTLVVS